MSAPYSPAPFLGDDRQRGARWGEGPASTSLAGPPDLHPTPNPLAVGPDPSLHASTSGGAAAAAVGGSAGAGSRSQVAWVRPSDLPTTVGRELMGRASDLQAAFARAVWRAPVTAVRAAHGTLAARRTPAPAPAPAPGLVPAPAAPSVAAPPAVPVGFDEPDLPLSGPDLEGMQLS